VDRTKRREQRFDIQLALALRQGTRVQRLLTENVSYRGLFVRTDTPPPLRQLVKLETQLPPEATPFVTHGMSVFVIQPDDQNGRAPGAGIQFYGMGDERRAWEAFVNHIRQKARVEGNAALGTGSSPSLQGPEPVRRRHERIAITLEVRPASVEDLMRLWTRDVSAGGMFLSASEPRPEVGARLQLTIWHPTTGGSFALDVIVRRHGDHPGGAGVGVEFLGMTDARRRELFQFITATTPVITPEELGLLIEVE
jgi:hypothetical protein